MVRLIILAALVGGTMAAVATRPATVGEKVEFTIKGVSTWERTVGGKKQTIRHCSPTEKNIACGSWVDEDGKPVAEGAHVSKDGRLTIYKVTLADTGSYTSPDEKPRVTQHGNGSISMLAPTMFRLRVRDFTTESPSEHTTVQ